MCGRDQIFLSHPSLLRNMIEMDSLEIGTTVCIISQGPHFLPGRAGVEGGANFYNLLQYRLISQSKLEVH